MQHGNGIRSMLRVLSQNDQTSPKVFPSSIVNIPARARSAAAAYLRVNNSYRGALPTDPKVPKNETSLKQTSKVAPAKIVDPFAGLRRSTLPKGGAAKKNTTKKETVTGNIKQNKKNTTKKETVTGNAKQTKKNTTKKEKRVVTGDTKRNKKNTMKKDK